MKAPRSLHGDPEGERTLRQQLLDALETADQTISELSHALSVGPKWFTKGEGGQRQHASAWTTRGQQAIAAALARAEQESESQ
jgi:uncharacterized damage-inducible protein DinB